MKKLLFTPSTKKSAKQQRSILGLAKLPTYSLQNKIPAYKYVYGGGGGRGGGIMPLEYKNN